MPILKLRLSKVTARTHCNFVGEWMLRWAGLESRGCTALASSGQRDKKLPVSSSNRTHIRMHQFISSDFQKSCFGKLDHHSVVGVVNCKSMGWDVVINRSDVLGRIVQL